MGKESISGTEFSNRAVAELIRAIDAVAIRQLAEKTALPNLSATGASLSGETHVAALNNEDMQRGGGRSEGLV